MPVETCDLHGPLTNCLTCGQGTYCRECRKCFGYEGVFVFTPPPRAGELAALPVTGEVIQ